MRTFTTLALIAAAAVLLASTTTAKPNAAEYKDSPSDYGQAKHGQAPYGDDAVSPDYQDKNDYGNDDAKDNYRQEGPAGGYGEPKAPCPDDGDKKGDADVSTYGDVKGDDSAYPEHQPATPYAPVKDLSEYDDDNHAPHHGGGGGAYPEVVPVKDDDVYGPPMPAYDDDYGRDAFPWGERPRRGRRPGRRPRRKVCKCVDKKDRRRRPRRDAKDDYRPESDYPPYGQDDSVKDNKESAYPTKPVEVDDYAKTAYPEGGAQPAHYQEVDDAKAAY